MRVAYILGLAHSGTTIIDRILSCYPGVIGLGEVEHIIRRVDRGSVHNLTCPCGAKSYECPFWKDITARRYETHAEFFAEVVRTAREQGYSTLIDSSKSVGTSTQYARLLGRGDISDLAVLRIVRDPRGWVHSMMRRESVDPADEASLRGLFNRWLVASMKFDAKVKRRKENTLYVWYDRLILAREENKLAGLLGLPAAPDDEISLAAANQHAMTGNKFAFSKKREKLTYDTRWLESPVIEQIYASLPLVRNYYHELQKLHLSKGAQISDALSNVDISEFEASLEMSRIKNEKGTRQLGIAAL